MFHAAVDTDQVGGNLRISVPVTSYSIAHSLFAQHPAAGPGREPDQQCVCLGRSSGSVQVG